MKILLEHLFLQEVVQRYTQEELAKSWEYTSCWSQYNYG